MPKNWCLPNTAFKVNHYHDNYGLGHWMWSTVRALIFGRHQFFGTSEHSGKAHGSLLSGWMNYACCWFSTSRNILILPSQFWQIRFESCWLYSSKCRILVVLRYMKNKQTNSELCVCSFVLWRGTIYYINGFIKFPSSYIHCHIRGSIHSINKWRKENKCFQYWKTECFWQGVFQNLNLPFPFAARQPQILVSVYHYADKYLRALITMLQIVSNICAPW